MVTRMHDSAPPVDLTLDTLIPHLHSLLREHEGHPGEAEIRNLCETLYAASLLKEEGRPVRVRVVIAPHAIRFSPPQRLTPNEITRLSPAAGFFHSVVAIWPDRDRGFRIWGILNTGPRWLNHVAGGRKSSGRDLAHPLVQVRDPGWLLFYRGYELLAEWRGTEFHGPRIDVFQANLLRDRFTGYRRKMVENLADDCLPCSLCLETYADLGHLIALQFVKRVINLVRTSGHGGSLVLLPSDGDEDLAAQWIDCKYSSEPDESGSRFATLLQAMIRRVGELSPPDATLAHAWDIFRNSMDSQLDELEEAFFEQARLFSDLMQVDGALVVDQGMRVIGFGGEIRVDRNVLQVFHAIDLDATRLHDWNVQADGTRHRSVYRLCSVDPRAIGFVISQDSQVRLIANVNDSVVFWNHTMI
jgi:hypothetical protein